MRLIGKSGTALNHEYNCLIKKLSKDIKLNGEFTCWYTFKIIDGIKIYTSYRKIDNYRTDAMCLIKNHEKGEYFESIKATDLLKILKKRNKVG